MKLERLYCSYLAGRAMGPWLKFQCDDTWCTVHFDDIKGFEEGKDGTAIISLYGTEFSTPHTMKEIWEVMGARFNNENNS